MGQKQESSSCPFFIVGVQRSGTTLLRLILNAHSQIAIPEEARFLGPLLKRNAGRTVVKEPALSRLLNYLRANEQFRLWAYDSELFFQRLAGRDAVTLAELIDAMFSSYAESEGKSRWGDKSLFFNSINILHELFPGARFIHVVRDGRDVFDSWRRMDATKSRPTVMALDWRYKLRSIERSVARLPADRTLTLRYEDLLASPRQIVQSICSFLNIEFEEEMFEFYKTSSKYIGEHHSSLIFSAINSSNAAKWKQRLSADEIKLYEAMAGKLLREYGYQTSSPSFSAHLLLLAAVDLLIGLPQRVWQVMSARWAYRRALRRGEAMKTIPTGVMPRSAARDPGKLRSKGS